MQNVIKRFIQARKHLRLTQADLATSLGFKQSYISNIEKGRNEVTSNIVIAMYRLYNISPEWLITGQGEMMSRFTHSGPPDFSPAESTKPNVLATTSEDQDYPSHETLMDLLKSKDTTIQMQEKVIALLESELARFKKMLMELESKA
jgi:transcriptional regulator with XRE-family HTH domain